MAGIRERGAVGAAVWLRRTGRRAFVLPVMVLALAAVPASARAAGTPTATVAVATNPTTTATSPTTTSPASATSASTSTIGGQRDNRGVAVAALIFGLLAAAAILFFVARDRDRTLGVYEKLVRSGAAVEVVNVPAQAGEPAVARSAAEADVSAPPEVMIDGPSTIVVGASSEYVARLDGVQVVATWTASPSTAIEPPTEATSRLPVTARQSGPFTLTAAAPGATAGTMRVTAATPAPTRTQSLPFLGAGWGSVVVAVIIASVTAALGLAGQLGGEAVATILGALVGYVVAKGQTESAARAPSSPGAGDATGGGAGQGS